MAQDRGMLWRASSPRGLAVLGRHRRAQLTALALISSRFKPRWFVSCNQPLSLVSRASAAARWWGGGAGGSSLQTPAYPGLRLCPYPGAGWWWGGTAPLLRSAWGTAAQPWLVLQPVPGDARSPAGL